MALPHARLLDVVTVRPLGAALADAVSTSLIKTDRLQLLHLVLPNRHDVPAHKVDDECVIHCLEGDVEVRMGLGTRRLGPGQFVVLPAGETHALQRACAVGAARHAAAASRRCGRSRRCRCTGAPRPADGTGVAAAASRGDLRGACRRRSSSRTRRRASARTSAQRRTRCQPARAYRRSASPPVTVSSTSTCAAFAARLVIDRIQQAAPDASAAAAAMHEHLRDVGPMRLVLGKAEHELHGAEHALRVFRHEQRPLAARDAVDDAAPERRGLGARHRLHEAHRRTAFDAVDEHVGQGLDQARPLPSARSDAPSRLRHPSCPPGGAVRRLRTSRARHPQAVGSRSKLRSSGACASLDSMPSTRANGIP